MAQNDVTAAPADQQARWQALILHNVRESIIVTDLDGIIIYWNAGAATLFGYTAAEMLGRTPAVLYPEEDPGRLQMDLAAIVAGQDYHGAWLGRHKDGTRLWVDITTSPLYDDAGTAIGFLGVARDITAQHDVDEAREGFLTAVVHDLKTPLTGIRGHAQLAARRLARLRLPAGTPLTEHLAQIEAGTQRLARLIDELTDVMRLRTGTALELERRPTDVVALVRAVVAQQQGLSGHHLAVEAASPVLEAAVDGPRLERVVGNLLTNALKYSPTWSAITIRVAATHDDRGPGVSIVVQDQGIGIPAADLPHIFTRFHRARNAVGVVEGTGLGLSSAQAIVAQHGGTIDVESTEGVGTTVSVWLPARPAA